MEVPRYWLHAIAQTGHKAGIEQAHMNQKLRVERRAALPGLVEPAIGPGAAMKTGRERPNHGDQPGTNLSSAGAVAEEAALLQRKR